MASHTTPGAGALGCCPHCGSGLAYPLHCKRAGEDTWKLRLRCPDCERTWSRCAPTLDVRRFDRRLADDRRSLVEHLREIERIEREGEIERFSSALAADPPRSVNEPCNESFSAPLPGFVLGVQPGR